MSGVQQLRELSRSPSWRRWAVAATSGRLLGTMSVLAYVLIAEEVYDSIALGALLAGAGTFSAGLAAPFLGRALDRDGLRRGLLRSLWATAGVLTLQLLVVASAGPTWMLFCLAVLQGVSYSAIPGAYRALLVPSVSAVDLPRANTVDAVLTEIAFVAGPVVASVAAAVTGPVGIVAVMVLTVVGAALVTRHLPPVPPMTAGAVVPWRRPASAVVYGMAFAVGISLGLLESVIAARVVELGQAPETAGIHLTLVAVGSGLAGFVISTLEDQRGRIVRRVLVGLVAFGAALAFASLAPTALLLGLAMVFVGVPIAPLNALGMQRLQDTLDDRQLAEGFALYSALLLVGVGIGDLITGRLLDQVGAVWLLELSAAVPAGLAALMIATLRVRTRARAADPARRG